MLCGRARLALCRRLLSRGGGRAWLLGVRALPRCRLWDAAMPSSKGSIAGRRVALKKLNALALRCGAEQARRDAATETSVMALVRRLRQRVPAGDKEEVEAAWADYRDGSGAAAEGAGVWFRGCSFGSAAARAQCSSPLCTGRCAGRCGGRRAERGRRGGLAGRAAAGAAGPGRGGKAHTSRPHDFRTPVIQAR